MRWKKVVLISLVGAAIGGVACAARHHASTPEERAARMEALVTKRVEHVLDEIDATDDQRTRVLTVKDRLVGEFRQAHEGSKGTRAHRCLTITPPCHTL